MSSDERRNGRRPPRWILLILASAAFVGVLWLVFTVLISDPALALSYVEALAWPLVAVATLYWLRFPLRQKLQQLLKLQMLGGSAEFRSSLEDELRPDVDQLTSVQPDSDEYDGALPLATEGPGQDMVVEPEPAVSHEMSSQPGEAPSRPGLLQHELDESHREDLVALAEAAGLVDGEGNWAERLAQQPQLTRKRLLSRLRKALSGSERRSAATRDSVESIVQKSAAWGYDVGASGAPRLVPDIAWNDDGTWRITTEVPAGRSNQATTKSASGSVTRDLRLANSSRRRGIERLEEEIIKREQEQARMGTIGIAAAVSDPYVLVLKDRLRSIDPGNPFART